MGLMFLQVMLRKYKALIDATEIRQSSDYSVWLKPWAKANTTSDLNSLININFDSAVPEDIQFKVARSVLERTALSYMDNLGKRVPIPPYSTGRNCKWLNYPQLTEVMKQYQVIKAFISYGADLVNKKKTQFQLEIATFGIILTLLTEYSELIYASSK